MLNGEHGAVFKIELTRGPSWHEPVETIDYRECGTHSMEFAAAEALHQVFVEQTGLNQSWIEARQIAKVGVVKTQLHARMNLDAHGQEAAAQSESRARLVAGRPIWHLVSVCRLRIQL